MLIIPAIDIKKGKVVRLVEGRYREKVYFKDPLRCAFFWQSKGVKMLHIVDLDGARIGRPKNLFWVKKILKNINIPIEFGGGIRDLKTIENLLKIGVNRVVIGTKAVDFNFLKEAFKNFSKKIIVSIDEKEGNLFTEGWFKKEKGIKIFDFLGRLKEIGFKEIIYTDIARDGTLKGPNIKKIKAILKANLKLFVSGGISSLEDIIKLKKLEDYGLEGVIIGKALYEGRLDIEEALRLAKRR